MSDFDTETLIRLNKTRADFAETFEELIESYPERDAGDYAVAS